MKKILIILFMFASFISNGQNLKGFNVRAFETFTADTTYTPTGLEPRGYFYWDDENRTGTLVLGKGVKLQLGEESIALITNDTGDTLKDGRVVGFDKIHDDITAVRYASNYERHQFFGATTEDIPPDSAGIVVSLIGKIRGLNTGTLTVGPVYLDTLGYFTNTKPVFPTYTYPLGFVQKTGITDGVIQFRSDGVNFNNSITDAFDGTIRETFDFRTFVEGGNIYGVITNPSSNSDSLTLVFSSGWYDFITPDTIQLTAGTSGLTGVLANNYVYIPEDTKVLTVSTSDFPTDEFAQVAVSNLSDAANTLLVGGAYGNQNINNHFKTDNDNGHLIHAFDWIRWQAASWGRTGLAASLTAGTSTLQWAATGGKVRQFHQQTIPALDMALGDYMLVKNDPDYPFRPVLDAGYLDEYSDGSGWNAEWAPFIVWAVGNKTGEKSFLVLNLPRNGYNTEQAAMDDVNGYADFTIPENFISKSILLGKYAVRRVGTSYTHNPSTGYLDLRGTIPSSAPGGASGSSGVTDYTQLNQTPATLEALAFQRVDAGATTLENVLASAILLNEFDSTGTTWAQSQVVGLNDTTAALRTDINTNTANIVANEVDYGLNNQLPITNSTVDGFDYFTGLEFDGGFLRIPNGAGAAKAGTISLGVIDLFEFASVGTPPSGRGYIYFDSDGAPHSKNDAGVEYNLSAGSGYTGVHSSLTGLDYASAAHTGFVSDLNLTDSLDNYLLTRADTTGFTLEQSQVVGLGDSLDNRLSSVSNDSTSTGIKTWFGGSIPSQSSSGARLQINGFMRTGNLYVHEGGNTPNVNAGFFSNLSGSIAWNSAIIYNTANSNLSSIDWNAKILTAESLDANNLTIGIFPYDNGTGLVNSNVYTDGTSTSIGTSGFSRTLTVQGVFGLNSSVRELISMNPTSTGLDILGRDANGNIDFRIDTRTGSETMWYNGAGSFVVGSSSGDGSKFYVNGDAGISGTLSITSGTLSGEAMDRNDIEALITGGTEDADFLSTTTTQLNINDANINITESTTDTMVLTDGTGSYNLSDLAVTGTDFIENQTASPQTAGFNITGNALIGGTLDVTGDTDFDGDMNIGNAKTLTVANYVDMNYAVLQEKGSSPTAITAKGIIYVTTTDDQPNFRQSDGSLFSFDLTSTSDFWKKKNFKLIDSPLDKILALKSYSFDWKDSYPKIAPTDSINVVLQTDTRSRESSGFIAQEAINIIPEIVSEVDESGYLQIDYDALVPYLVEAIKEQQKQIEDLQKQIDELK